MKKSFKTQLTVTGIAVLCALVAYATTGTSKGGPGFAPRAEPKAYPQVTTVEATEGTFIARIEGYGEVAPVQRLNLAAEVSGKVIELSPGFNMGERFNAGDVLLKIDDYAYCEAVASARSTLAAAEVTLLQQQLNRTQAKAEWKRSGLTGSPDSRLALFEPQVKAAQAAVEHARRALEKASADLDKTVIRAPFNGIVISRSIELGGYLQAGAELAVLYGADQVELQVPLSASAWRNLPSLTEQNQEMQNKDWLVTLSDTESDRQWQGYVDRVAQHVDSGTRQRALIVRVDNPLDQTPPLFPGTFIQANVPGNTLKDVWQVPASAISQNNEIWFVDEANMLAKAPADIRLRMADKAYLTPHQEAEHLRVVMLPLASYLPGMKVEPTTVELETRVPATVSDEPEVHAPSEFSQTGLSQTKRSHTDPSDRIAE